MFVVGFAEGERESLFGGFEEKGIWLYKMLAVDPGELAVYSTY